MPQMTVQYFPAFGRISSPVNFPSLLRYTLLFAPWSFFSKAAVSCRIDFQKKSFLCNWKACNAYSVKHTFVNIMNFLSVIQKCFRPVGIGLIKPINFQRRVFKPINFWKNSIEIHILIQKDTETRQFPSFKNIKFINSNSQWSTCMEWQKSHNCYCKYF